mmetsp:Transcript_1886/g.4977  ORF Transcript_1886/g.4977 Transcript_1886/m.4977 type:complete len:203 (+) Transcript_1886:1127-1735(+)
MHPPVANADAAIATPSPSALLYASMALRATNSFSRRWVGLKASLVFADALRRLCLLAFSVEWLALSAAAGTRLSAASLRAAHPADWFAPGYGGSISAHADAASGPTLGPPTLDCASMWLHFVACSYLVIVHAIDWVLALHILGHESYEVFVMILCVALAFSTRVEGSRKVLVSGRSTFSTMKLLPLLIGNMLVMFEELLLIN